MKINPYLNFAGNTEEAFNFYKSVFGGEFTLVMRFKDNPEASEIPEGLSEKIMHISLPIGDEILMGSDAPEEMGYHVNFGNNMYMNLTPDSREQTKEIFDKLAQGGNVEMELQDAFWGDYFGSLTDKYGVQWMLNFPNS